MIEPALPELRALNTPDSPIYPRALGFGGDHQERPQNHPSCGIQAAGEYPGA
jgi:hypothetical protein